MTTATSTTPQGKYNDEIGAAPGQAQPANVMMVPKMDKIVVNMGVGEAVSSPSSWSRDGDLTINRPAADR